ncbi:putative cell wall glucanase (Scw4) [Aspergillus clavatus NRRL 1]|uniref:Cell wall glucanase (Scw4), putative n=1 Tax=Aspergillus clavatus (strain ATCC 1007 / CBS 513.65 / DSM 816 / NCTC 3887 / NRRL 1 / QM 1276 / 107) TaxID=344612 RepID=A1CU80_ASPCL|nr:cell wall glucanase (Scw4), putative [Aspergillus clavatus NRRL 1]EAW06867.1 cell wall glucanase (Scw4), putative [Aspergillus clavatus NRRL 1]
MKAKLLIGLLTLRLVFHAAAHPHAGHRRHVQRDGNPLDPVIVWVDKAGQIVHVEDDKHQTPNAAQEPTDLSLPLPLPAANDLLSHLPIQVPDLTPEPGPPAPAGPPPRRFGISYSPYNSDSTCKTPAQIDADVARLTHHAFIRIYGVDCDQTRLVTQAAKTHGMRVFAGVFDLPNLPASLDAITAAAAGDWAPFHTISIGNELVNRGASTPADVVAALHTARAALRAAGYQGPVVTVDTFAALQRHPELCAASDYCAANCHAFFDEGMTPERAGEYAMEQARRVSEAAGGKRTVIAESGWPHAGRANGRAVPSKENQRVAVESLRRVFAGEPDLVLFSAFDDLWKTDGEGTFDAEKFWGIQE